MTAVVATCTCCVQLQSQLLLASQQSGDAEVDALAPLVWSSASAMACPTAGTPIALASWHEAVAVAPGTGSVDETVAAAAVA